MSDRMRITGMYSGMDTESIVQQLVATKQTKVDDLKNEQKKLEWKQTAWQDLNAKIYSLYSGTLSKLRLSGNLNTRKTTCSDTTKATVSAGSGAVNGTQSLKIKKLAKSGYLTGAKLDSSLKFSSTSAMQGISSDLTGQKIKVTAKVTMKEGETYVDEFSGKTLTASGGEEVNKTTEIEFTEDMKITDFVSKLREAGVNASFDESNQRFFISSTKTGLDNEFKIEDVDGGDALKLLGLDTTAAYSNGSKATRIDAQDAVIELNGSEFTSSSNTFTINGLTINALAETADDEELSIVTDTDVDGIYETIKDFFTEYNELINEMDKLYNADSARKYSMLSSDEKESMTDEEVETWENTIKGALLRKDTQLNAVMNALTNTMLAGCEVDGKKKYLSDYGIKTLSYFTAKDNEHHAYHIDGDPDDESTSSEDDKLKAALREDPDGTVAFFSGMFKNLYSSLDKIMSESTDYSSIYKVYNDKQLKSQYDDYTDKIKDAEDKLSDYEDRWYDKFTKMETALAKLQSNQSAISGLLGTNS